MMFEVNAWIWSHQNECDHIYRTKVTVLKNCKVSSLSDKTHNMLSRKKNQRK